MGLVYNERKSMKKKNKLWEKGSLHYKKFNIQPAKFINDNQLLFAEGNIIKYITRYRFKNGAEDLRKAEFYLRMLIEREEEYADGDET